VALPSITGSQQPWDSHPSLIPKNTLEVDLTQHQWTNTCLVYDFNLKCFYLNGNLVYFSRLAPPPDHPRHVYIRDNQVFQSNWTDLPLANEWRLSILDQETVAKQIQSLQGQNPLALQHHESYPSGYHYDSITSYTYHVTNSSQAILCEATHLFTKLVDVTPL